MAPKGRRDDRSDRGNHTRQQASQSPATSSVSHALQEAEGLQQRAERKRGAEAIQAHQQAAERFRRAAELARGASSAENLTEAYFGLAESLQSWGDAVLEVCSRLPDADLSPSREQEASTLATNLYHQSVDAYQQVRTAGGAVRVDALVNSGNALAAAAELAPRESALQLLPQAAEAYSAALQQEEDAATLSNLGDVLMSWAEALCDAGQQEAASQCFARGRQAYSQACSLSSSENGDDLPGLLHNWGVGLATLAAKAPDPAAVKAAFEEARQRLQASIAFDRGDPVPHTALGDLLSDQAERLIAAAAASGNPDPPSFGTAGGGPAASLSGNSAAPAADLAGQNRKAVLEEAWGLLQQALQEGYGGALRINARDFEAAVGAAEVHFELGKVAAAMQRGDEAGQLFAKAADLYASALAGGIPSGSFQERCDARYNYACACARSGRLAEAQRVLQELLARGGTAPQDIVADEDFAGLRSEPWFAELTASHPQVGS